MMFSSLLKLFFSFHLLKHNKRMKNEKRGAGHPDLKVFVNNFGRLTFVNNT